MLSTAKRTQTKYADYSGNVTEVLTEQIDSVLYVSRADNGNPIATVELEGGYFHHEGYAYNSMVELMESILTPKVIVVEVV